MNTVESNDISITDLRMVVAAGGTGGHIFPALAVVERLQNMVSGSLDVRFLGSEDRMEATMLPQLGYKYTSMPIQGFRGLTSPSTLLLPFKIATSVKIARRVIQGHAAKVVLTTGAYMSYPAGVAAAKENVPLVIMESNVNPGKTNKQLAKKASAILLAFAEGRDYFPESVQHKIHVVGNPIRRQITANTSAGDARVLFGLSPSVPTVLVFGGSLGAQTINRSIETIINRWSKTGFVPEYQIIWQTGRSYTPTIPKPLEQHIVARPFIDNMGEAYAAADIVVSRSGATTIAELALVGVPAILVPLPSASTNEQQINAEVVEKRGGGIIVNNADAEVSLVDTIEVLLVDPLRRAEMGKRMKTLAAPNAADDAANIVLELANG